MVRPLRTEYPDAIYHVTARGNAKQAFVDRLRALVKDHDADADRLKKMHSLNDTFQACTWYRDHWTRDRIILRGAKG